MLILKKYNFCSYLVRIAPQFAQNIPKHARYSPLRDQRPSETKKVDFVFSFSVESGATDHFAAEW